MKKALSRKNIWESLPRIVRSCAGGVLGRLPPAFLLGGKFSKNLQFLRESQWWPRERTEEYQLAQLRRLCALAYKSSPFWRDQFDRAALKCLELRTLADLRSLPTIDKETVRASLKDMCVVPVDSPDVDHVSTGGTGGVPLFLYIGTERSAVEYAYLVASWERAGYRLGMPLAEFRGRVVSPDFRGLRHEYDAVLRRHYYSNFHMADDQIRRYLDHISGIGPCFLHVYPSSAFTLAQAVARTGQTVPQNVIGVLAGSENVYPDHRLPVEQTFRNRFFSWYGHSEKLVMAAECEHGTDYHVWPTYGYFELLDKEGQSVAEPGKRGEIVGTGFINNVIPLFRYRTGDFATYVGDRCEACGRQHTIIRDIRGHRTQEVLIAADGSHISWTALNMHDDTFLHVKQFQFYQDTPGKAVLHVVPAAGFGSENREKIHRNLGCKLDGQIAFDIELADSIPLTPRGKMVYVDQRIKNAHNIGEVKNQGHSTVSFTLVDRRTATGHALKALPPPPYLPNTQIIEPVAVYRANGVAPSPPLKFPHPVRKLLAFMLQEGPVWTWRKAASFRLTLNVDKELALIVAVGKAWGTDRYCVGCGQQFSARLPQMLFREELVFDAEDEAHAFETAQRIMEILQPRPELVRQLADFSLYSTEPAPVLPGVERPRSARAQNDRDVPTTKTSVPADFVPSGTEENHLFCIGAGAYAVVFVLPHLRNLPFDTVVEYNPLRAQVVARKFGFRHFETDYRRVLDRAASLGRIVVLVANYHSHHADTAIDFLKANPQACLFIEKPAVVGYEQFERFLPYMRDPSRFVEIGFNRRYTDMVKRAKRLLEGRKEPLAVTCLVHEDAMEPSHWYFWKTEGTRVYGNLCHWIDLGVHLIGSRPVEIVTLADRDFQTASSVAVRFEDGSLLNLVSGDQGDRLRGVQEYIDIRTGLLTIQIHDFRKMVVMQDGRHRIYRNWTRDKGHVEMYRVLSHSVLNSLRPQYTSTDFVRTSVLTEEIYRTLASGQRHRRLDVAAMMRWESASPSAVADLHESRPDSCRTIVS